jgi:hypothetical protein
VDVAAALWGGIAGAVALVAVYIGFYGLRLTRLDLVGFEGGLVTAERGPLRYVYGTIVHVVLGALAALAYRWVFQQVDAATYVGWGALVGLAHGVLAVLALPLAARLNGRVRRGEQPSPGFAGLAYGRLTPLAIVAAHVVFGIWVGLVLLPKP